MNTTIKTPLLLVFAMVAIVACDGNKFVEYKPHYFNPTSDQKYYGDAELDSTEFVNTQHVLTYYGEAFKTENDNVILITKELANDWDLLWNYTTKANDSEWLETH